MCYAMNHRQRLKELLIERSLEKGEFTLASGRRSTYYVDARRTTMAAEGQYLIGKVGLGTLRASGLAPTHVGGMTMGADPVSYAIAHESWTDGPPMDAFSVRKTAKDHGTGRQIEGGLPSGARVVLVEDSITSGGSALRALDALEAHGAEVLAALVVVDRQEGGAEALGTRGVKLLSLFTAEDLLAG